MTDRELTNEMIKRADEFVEKQKREFAIVELEKIKDEINEMSNANPSYWYTCDVVDRADLIDMIDNYISELKGE